MFVSVMTVSHLKTGVEPTAEILCILSIIHAMDSDQHNCGISHYHIQGCIQKFLDWPLGARTANGTALCH